MDPDENGFRARKKASCVRKVGSLLGALLSSSKSIDFIPCLSVFICGKTPFVLHAYFEVEISHKQAFAASSCSVKIAC